MKGAVAGVAVAVIGVIVGWLLFAPQSPFTPLREPPPAPAEPPEYFEPPPPEPTPALPHPDEIGEPEQENDESSSVSSVSSKTCVVSGCSGQVCGDEEVITTCEWKEEYACYQNAICEVQTDGECGWTMTTELQTCLAGETHSADDARCAMEPATGPCKAAFKRYFFDGSSCAQFTWGGCGGSVPFETMEECQQVCE